MKKYILKIVFIILILVTCVSQGTKCVYASTESGISIRGDSKTLGSKMEELETANNNTAIIEVAAAVTPDFWGQATNWFSKGDRNKSLGSAQEVINTFSDMVNVIGTSVIVVITIFLGVKYMFGSVSSKTEVKESLVTLIIACIFFFGWTSISDLLFANNTFIFTSDTDMTYTNIVGRLFATAISFAQIGVIAAVIYVGVRYIFAGATGKAELKGKSTTFLIGIILAFATTNFLGFISNAINEVAK